MNMDQYLLSDQQMQRFIVDGYILVRAEFSEPVHETIYGQLETVFAEQGNIGNNILPRIPLIQRVFGHPALVGALTSLLGPDYTMNPHRHCHLNPPGSSGQTWHKDCYVFDHNIRQPRFRWLLALYYPQDVSPDMGPTGLLPGRQYYDRVSNPDASRTTEEAQGLCGPAGTVALVHFDAWHRAMANTSAHKRYMLKFQFARLAEPRQPTWNCTDPVWEPPAGAERLVWRDVWQWLGGRTTADTAADTVLDEGVWDDLHAAAETDRLLAAFRLGQLGEAAVPGLLQALGRQAREVADRVEDKTPANAHGTNPTACHAAQALVAVGQTGVPHLSKALGDRHWWVRASVVDVLGQLGPLAAAAVPDLSRALEDEHWWVRRGAAEALGRQGPLARSTAGRLADRLGDADRRVRRMAALALAQLGGPADAAMVKGLQGLLGDRDRYNRFYGALALRRLQGGRARAALLEALSAARWCPVTNKASNY